MVETKRVRKIAKRVLAEKDRLRGRTAEVQAVRREASLIARSFVPSRTGVSEDDVRSTVEFLGNESEQDLVEAAKKNPGTPRMVGGDVRVGEPPYIFRFDGETGKFEDNIVS